jgi:hypothetical protein
MPALYGGSVDQLQQFLNLANMIGAASADRWRMN